MATFDESIASTPSIPPEVRAGGVVSGKFRVDRVLGEGGMGVVVAATHLQLDEPVALKFLRAEAVSESEALARFMREARAAAKLKSEHVARVLDVDVTTEGSPYIVMEYLEGRDLGRTIQATGPLDVPSAAEYVVQACEGLAEAHARGIVHRDIKPENLFLVDRANGWKSIKILDFGISKFAASPGVAHVSTRAIMGSPCYMSPEQLRSTAMVDHRTDIWALGATLFEILSGRTAYEAGRTLPELVTAILENPAPRLIDLRPDSPPELTAIIVKCLEKDRERRFASAAELAVALLPFAPKRARTSVERALAMTRSASQSSDALEVASKNALPSAPPPGSADAPATAPTMRARSGSDLLSKPPPSKTPSAGTLPTLALPSNPVTSMHPRRMASWLGLAASLAVLALVASWQVARGRRSDMAVQGGAPGVPGASSAASLAGFAAAPPLPSSPPAAVPASAEADVALPSAASASAASAAPSASAAPQAQPPHRPGPNRTQHPAQSPPNPQASPDRDLDIRMQR